MRVAAAIAAAAAAAPVLLLPLHTDTESTTTNNKETARAADMAGTTAALSDSGAGEEEAAVAPPGAAVPPETRRDDGPGHALDAMPCAEQAASVAAEKTESARERFWAKAASTAARTARSAPAAEAEDVALVAIARGNDDFETSTATSKRMGARAWPRRCNLRPARPREGESRREASSHDPSSWETSTGKDAPVSTSLAATTWTADRGTRASWAKPSRSAQTKTTSLTSASGSLPRKVTKKGTRFGGGPGGVGEGEDM